MTQQVSTPPEPSQQTPVQPLAEPWRQVPHSKWGIISLLALVCMLLVLFTSLSVHNLYQLATQPPPHKAQTHRHITPTASQDQDGPLSVAGHATPVQLHLPVGRAILYEQGNAMYVVHATDGTPQKIATPGYVYNRAISPLITPSGQLLYSGDGLWLTNIVDGVSQQIATLNPGQVITSMVLSSDGTQVAWSTEPADGKGNAYLYAGLLLQSAMIYHYDVANCPCLRVFSFFNAANRAANSTLLLTDDRGDHRTVRYGLWTFDVTTAANGGEPRLLLDENPQQGPLSILPSTTMLLYSSFEGVTPAPSDNSVPDEIATLNYPNSLLLTSIDAKTLTLGKAQTILSEQHDLGNSAQYHWVTTPRFSADEHTLIYIEFSVDAQAPFDRHSAIYTVQIHAVGSKLSVGRPQLLATSNDLFVELGAWLNSHTLTLYSDGTIYGLDVQTGAIAPIIETDVYAHPIAAVDQGQ